MSRCTQDPRPLKRARRLSWFQVTQDGGPAASSSVWGLPNAMFFFFPRLIGILMKQSAVFWRGPSELQAPWADTYVFTQQSVWTYHRLSAELASKANRRLQDSHFYALLQ